MDGGNPSQVGRLIAKARNGMVCAPHFLATEAGVETLARGRSAVDVTIDPESGTLHGAASPRGDRAAAGLAD
jgi:hypothetical protein